MQAKRMCFAYLECLGYVVDDTHRRWQDYYVHGGKGKSWSSKWYSVDEGEEAYITTWLSMATDDVHGVDLSSLISRG